MAHDDVEVLLPGDGPAAANQLRRRGLTLDQAGRLRTLPPVSHHLAEAHAPEETDWQRAIAHYCRLSETLGVRAGSRGGGEAIGRLARDAANIAAAVGEILAGEQPEEGYAAAHAFINAARFSGVDAASITGALLAAARGAYEQALALYASIEDPYSVGVIHRRLARVADDPEARCAHVSEARNALLKIGRHDFVADLEAEFPDCEQ